MSMELREEDEREDFFSCISFIFLGFLLIKNCSKFYRLVILAEACVHWHQILRASVYRQHVFVALVSFFCWLQNFRICLMC